jgi:hypothetical protein
MYKNTYVCFASRAVDGSERTRNGGEENLGGRRCHTTYESTGMRRDGLILVAHCTDCLGVDRGGVVTTHGGKAGAVRGL